MSNPYRRLVSETGLYALSSMGSTAVAFLLLPLYTNYLSAMEFGTADLVMVVVQLLLPVVSLSIYDGVFRFALDPEHDSSVAFSVGFILTLIGVVVLSIGVVLAFLVLSRDDFDLLIFGALLLVLQANRSLLAQFARATRRLRLFATDGIVMAAVTGLASVVALAVFDLGIDGYFLGLLAANAISVVYLAASQRIHRVIRWRAFDWSLAKTMLLYSAPLVPNAMMWWLMSSSSRFVVAFFLGVAANGVFAVAVRIPNVLSVFTGILTRAWQVVAISERSSLVRSYQYSNVFNAFARANFLIVAAILVVLKPATTAFLGSDFRDSWQLVPILMVAVVFTNLASFVGTTYLTEFRTVGVFTTSLVSGILNLGLAFALVPIFGLRGAAIAKLSAAAALLFLRIRGTRKVLPLSVDPLGLLKGVLLVGLQTLLLSFGFSTSVEILVSCMLFLSLLATDASYIRSAARVLRRS